MSQRAHGQSKLCEWKSSLQYSNVVSPNSELYFDINFRLQVLLIVDSKSSLSRALKSVQEQKKWGKNDMLQRHWNKEERLKKAEGERLCQVCTFTNSKYVLFLPNKRTYLMDPTILKINHETTTKKRVETCLTSHMIKCSHWTKLKAESVASVSVYWAHSRT